MRVDETRHHDVVRDVEHLGVGLQGPSAIAAMSSSCNRASVSGGELTLRVERSPAATEPAM